jgi:phospholipid/cholesterol/gamma-HCH transport system ATP-binding protein
MISFNNISKSFNGKPIIKGIDGVFEKGKINQIIGASGTGKSVLIKCIVGLVNPDEGEVFYDDRSFIDTNREQRKQIRREIGMLFQSSALFDSKSVEENIRFPLDLLTHQSMEEKIERVNFCLERVHLENLNSKMPSELSGGMKKRVGIARAIVLNSKYLFCDEPNSGLDPGTSITIDNLIKEITEEFHTTTIVVTHDMNSVVEIGDNIIFLHQGEKKWQGTKSNIMQTDCPELEAFMMSSKLVREARQHWIS